MRTVLAHIGCVAVLSGLLVREAEGQSTGKVRLLVDPGDTYEFILDGTYRLQKREIELIEGPHRLQVWAPTRSIVDTTIQVKGGENMELLLRLPYAAEYGQYQQEMARFRRQQWLQRALPAAVTVGTGAFAVGSFLRYRNAYNDLQDAEASYATESVPREVTQLKEVTLPDRKDELQRSRTTFFVAGGVFALSAAATIYAFLRTGNVEPPAFQDKEKVRFDGLVWVPGPTGGTWAAGATIPLR
ncbi:MAG: hypothetical protein KDB88_04025 [Flavobacteriales bacterium]|nr:hypothetical protein [Flavobacteriales bacterium]